MIRQRDSKNVGASPQDVHLFILFLFFNQENVLEEYVHAFENQHDFRERGEL